MKNFIYYHFLAIFLMLPIAAQAMTPPTNSKGPENFSGALTASDTSQDFETTPQKIPSTDFDSPELQTILKESQQSVENAPLSEWFNMMGIQPSQFQDPAALYQAIENHPCIKLIRDDLPLEKALDTLTPEDESVMRKIFGKTIPQLILLVNNHPNQIQDIYRKLTQAFFAREDALPVMKTLLGDDDQKIIEESKYNPQFWNTVDQLGSRIPFENPMAKRIDAASKSLLVRLPMIDSRHWPAAFQILGTLMQQGKLSPELKNLYTAWFNKTYKP